MSEPVTPYAGTSGWSGSSSSKERAETEDANGTTSARQGKVLALLGSRHVIGPGNFVGINDGLTVKEVRVLTGYHHGQASSVLSVLHKEGHIARLEERRDRCQVYVLPEFVNGRAIEVHGRKGKVSEMTEAESFAADHLTAKVSMADSLGISMSTVRTHEMKIVLDYIRRVRG